MSTETIPKTADIGTSAPARPGDTLGYARVSTSEQNSDAQRDRLLEAGVIRVFTDVVSGKRFERPGLAELLDHARPGDRLCVTRLDRLGRSLRELLETVEDLKFRGIHLVSLEERLDTSSAAGELVFHVFGAIAHFEARLISERTRDGLAAARKRGRQPGRLPLVNRRAKVTPDRRAILTPLGRLWRTYPRFVHGPCPSVTSEAMGKGWVSPLVGGELPQTSPVRVVRRISLDPEDPPGRGRDRRAVSRGA